MSLGRVLVFGKSLWKRVFAGKVFAGGVFGKESLERVFEKESLKKKSLERLFGKESFERVFASGKVFAGPEKSLCQQAEFCFLPRSAQAAKTLPAKP